MTSTAAGSLLVRIIEIKGLIAPKDAPISKSTLPYVVVEFDKNETVVKAVEGSLSLSKFNQRATFDVSREAELDISVYVHSESTKHGDIHLGSCKLSPKLVAQPQEVTLTITNTNSTISFQYAFTLRNKKVLTIDEFDLLKVIGKGSFGKVMQVRKRDTGRIYAMKIIKKSHIISRDEVEHTLAERFVLANLRNPFIVNLKYSFQSADKLYLVLAFVNGGELFLHLQRGKFSEHRARVYCAELLCALDCLHKLDIIYRDLKPENILLDYNGHIALCDFGLCKLNMKGKEKTNTFCGTPEYLAPEILLNQGYSKSVDWWTLGILLYEMLTGLPPFYDENVNEMYRKIVNDKLVFPADISAEAKDILAKLLNRDPEKRLGAKGTDEIKAHPFFKIMDWNLLGQKKIPVPFKPIVTNEKDTSNFDEEFTSEVPRDSVVNDSHLSETAQKQFIGFTYNPEGLGGTFENRQLI